MRILIHNPNRIPELLSHAPLPGRESSADEILCFGGEHYRDISCGPEHTWRQILSHLPEGWKPEVYIHWSPEYNPIPQGIEEADCFTVGVFGDWNLGGTAIRAVGSAFDLLVADRPGTKKLKAAGFADVQEGLLWAHDPALHRLLPGYEGEEKRDIDVLFIGNLNHQVQYRRCRWIGRLAQLAGRCRVVAGAGWFGENYVEMLNRARIVFNHSVRGELNMRSYEAAACGAVLFTERDNEEIEMVFREGEECVLYGEEDMEERLLALASPGGFAERRRIAEAGRRRIADHTYAHHLGSLIAHIEAHRENRLQNGRHVRPFCNLSAEERSFRTIVQKTLSVHLRAHAEAARMIDLLPPTISLSEKAARLALEGNIQYVLARSGTDEKVIGKALSRAEMLFEEAIDTQAPPLAARLGKAMLLIQTGRQAPAIEELKQTAALLEGGALTSEVFRVPILPHFYDTVNVGIERIQLDLEPNTAEWLQAMRHETAGYVHRLLAMLLLGQNHFSEALYHARKASEHTSSDPAAQALLAQALKANGHLEEALVRYAAALEQNPFLFTETEEMAFLLTDMGRFAEASALCSRMRTMAAALHNKELAAKAEELAGHGQKAAKAQPPQGVTRLLAFPDWANSGSWLPDLRCYIEAARSRPLILMLRADPEGPVPPAQALRALKRYLLEEIGLAPEAIPAITLLNQSVPPADRWKLLRNAEGLLLMGHTENCWIELARNMGLPLVALEALRLTAAA